MTRTPPFIDPPEPLERARRRVAEKRRRRAVLDAARAAGLAVRTVERARAKAGVSTERSGFGKGAVYVWRLTCSPHARHARQAKSAGEHGVHGGTHGEHAPAETPVDHPADTPSRTCRACGEPMDPVLGDDDYHPGCNPRYREDRDR